LDVCGGDIYRKFEVFKIDLRFVITLTLLVVFTLLSNYILFQNFMNEFFSDNTFTHLVNAKKINSENLPYYLKFLIVVLFTILNFEFLKNINLGVTTDCFRLIGWGFYMFGFFLVFLHTITVWVDSSFKHLFANMLMEFFNISPFIAYVLFIIFLTKEVRNAWSFYDLDRVIPFLFNKVYYDYIVNFSFGDKIIRMGYFCYKVFDKGILEVFGPDGFSATAWNMIKNYKQYSSGYVYNYVCLFLIGVAYILIIIKYLF
jgi:NADH:ubiquinone oxidoreductase subunit 5 (subunit L)/multisubunit Na+/H+ antiporter MnhA subunit